MDWMGGIAERAESSMTPGILPFLSMMVPWGDADTLGEGQAWGGDGGARRGRQSQRF